MTLPTFDFTINVTNLLTILGGAWYLARRVIRILTASFHAAIQAQIRPIETRVEKLEDRVDEHDAMLARLGFRGERL